MRYKLDDLPSNAGTIPSWSRSSSAPRRWPTSCSRSPGAVTTFVVNGDKSVAASALARLQFTENLLKAITSKNERISQAVKDVDALLSEYRAALAKLIEKLEIDRRG